MSQHRIRLIHRLFFYLEINEMEEKKKDSKIKILKDHLTSLIKFITYDLWRLDADDVGKKKSLLYNSLKSVILTVRNSQELQLGARAASLTYRTLLSTVPVLAVMFAIARGFGFQNIIKNELMSYFESQSTVLETAMQFIDSSLEHAKGGVFAGVGVVVLLYTIFILFSDIEDNFNRIWQIRKGRTIQRRVIDYFALIIFLPVFIILNSSLSVMIGSSTMYFDTFSYILNPLVTQFLKFLPYLITIVVLMLLYKFMPNTHVKFINALIGAIVAGTIYQIFQMLYINGQIWITRYNAIYGSFAALPLLLLWLQFSWYIILLGVELSYSIQNLERFSFEKETKNISRRYYDFLTILITSIITKRFANEKKPLTKDNISEQYNIPIRLANNIIDDLENMKIVARTPISDNEHDIAYQPAVDINLISMDYLMRKIDEYGSEDFLIDTDNEYQTHWNALLLSRKNMYDKGKDVLLKDL